MVLVFTMIVSAMVILTPFKVMAGASDTFPLTRYMTNTPVTLHHSQIYLPNNIAHPKRQFRAAWISTVFNIDFPSKPGLSEQEIKNEYITILDNLQKLNMNAVIVQVRPTCDAFYKSELNPWSKFLTGVQGKDPGWDPLKWMVDETHNRNMEFHAWFNPYRVTNNEGGKDTGKTKEEILSTLADNNWAKQHPQYVLLYGNKLLLNPGEPEVQQFIVDSIMEVVGNYDIDAVHFDDYFYPYQSGKNAFGDNNEDLATYQKYGAQFKNIKDWRRNNVTTLVEKVSKAIKSEKPYVKFGISPLGIWGHYDMHPMGSPEGEGSYTPVTSGNTYDNIYADTRGWVKKGLIDYIAPQIYWYFAQVAAPYGELADWWANVVKGTNCALYIGQATYKIAANGDYGTDWKNPEEIPNQLRFNSMYPEIKGSIFFSYKDLMKNELGVTDKIKNEFFNEPALVPTMPWIDNTPPNSPNHLKEKRTNTGDTKLVWQDAANNDSQTYVIYRFDDKRDINLDNPANIIAKVRRAPNKVNMEYVINKDETKYKHYIYAVTALDRLQNESKPDFSIGR